MRRFVSSFAAFTLVVSAPGLVSDALAHGGQYRGPPGEIPPGSREPSDPPPPAEPPPPQTPSGEPQGPPTTGGPDAGGPTTPSGNGPGGPGSPSGGPPPGTGGGGPSGPTTPSRGPRAAKGAGFSGWAFWWGNNKDEILQLKSAVRRTQRGSVTGVTFGRPSATGIRSVTDEAIQTSIVPTLRALLVDESQSYHIRSAAELGLAKIGDTSIVETLRRMALNDGRSLHREIEETAALALGLMGRDDDATRDFLIGLVRDRSRDGTHARSFGAISLGLLGDREDREHAAMTAFLDVIATKEAGADIKPSCLTALGLLRNEAAIAPLVAMLRTGKAPAPGAVALTEVETAYAVAALGKIGRAGTGTGADETNALDEIVKIVERSKSKAGLNVRRSAVIALGQIAPQCAEKLQRKVIVVLEEVIDGNADEQERNFAVMSLARIGATRGMEPAPRKALVSQLRRVMEKSHGQTPAFAAMALGLIGRQIGDEGGIAPEDDIRAPLRARFAEGGEGQIRGAFALASGLVRDPLAADQLLETLNDQSADKRVRGWCALALGLIGSPDAVEAIRSTLKENADRDLRVQAATAAGLLGDATVIADVVAVLRDRDSSNYERGSAALALGQIGDERAIAALVDIARDSTELYQDLTRSLAVVALGQIGDRRDVPTLARFATDVNYRAHVPAITELLSIL